MWRQLPFKRHGGLRRPIAIILNLVTNCLFGPFRFRDTAGDGGHFLTGENNANASSLHHPHYCYVLSNQRLAMFAGGRSVGRSVGAKDMYIRLT